MSRERMCQVVLNWEDMEFWRLTMHLLMALMSMVNMILESL